MTIMTRILRLWKADIHGVMDQLEDQGLLLQQHLREMGSSLVQKETRIQQLAESKRLLQVECTAGTQEYDNLENDLELALRKNKDNIAKLLIRRQIVQKKHNDKLQQQCDALTEEQEQISQLLEEQRLQYEIFKIKADNYTLRCNRASDPCNGNLYAHPAGANDVDEHEIELEFIRRKEQFKNNGRTT